MSTRNLEPLVSARPGLQTRHSDRNVTFSQPPIPAAKSGQTGLKSTSGESVAAGRRRSNSQSQVLAAPQFLESGANAQKPRATAGQLRKLGSQAPAPGLTCDARPAKRSQAEFYVTLVLLNDTFATKHVHVPYYPETCKLGRPTGTKAKPHVSNGYFDSRVLSRNHACMYIDAPLGRLMVQDMGSSNGTYVNLTKLGATPVSVGVGDVINLGFNIQVETNHKQISARVDAVNVVSNTPRGAVLDLLPLLSTLALGQFSDADARHFEFLQLLCGAASSDEPGDSHTDRDSDMPQALKAFDHGMFSDIVPSLDEMFENLAAIRDDAGLYGNSGIEVSPELLSTLDFLGANLSRVKQQHTALASLERFFSGFATQIDQISARHVTEQVEKLDKERQLQAQQQKEQVSRAVLEHERKLAVQDQLVSTLEEEISRLQIERQKLLADSTAAAAAVKAVTVTGELRSTDSMINQVSDGSTSEKPHTDNEFVFTGNGDGSHDSLSKSPAHVSLQDNMLQLVDALVDSLVDSLVDAKPKHTLPGALLEEVEGKVEGKSRDIQIPNVMSADTAPQKPQTLELCESFVNQFTRIAAPFKNQGVAVSFLVVLAGLIYQNSRSA